MLRVAMGLLGAALLSGELGLSLGFFAVAAGAALVVLLAAGLT
jgi:hypothetical protein